MQLLHMCLAHSRCRVYIRFPIDRSVNAFFDDRQCVGPTGEQANLVVAPDCDLGHQVGPQFGNLWQCEPTKRRGCHLIRIGSRFIVIDVGNKLMEQFASTGHACAEFSCKLADEKLFHQLVKDHTAPRAGADNLKMLGIAFQD